MRRAVPRKLNPPRNGGAARETARLLNAGAAALANDLAENYRRIKLEQIHPRALLIVMTDVARQEAGFTTGNDLRQHWESSAIQRVSHFFAEPPSGWSDVLCPDGSRIFLKFNSKSYQLLSETDTPAVADNDHNDMPSKPKKHVAPPKKDAKDKKPIPAPAATTAPAEVKPVKPSSKAEKAPRPVKKPKKDGNYPWILRRLQAQIISQLTTPANRATVRDGLAKCEGFIATRLFCENAKVAQAGEFEQFLDKEFFAATINR